MGPRPESQVVRGLDAANPALELRGEGLCLVLRLKPDQQLTAALAAVRSANHKLADWKRVGSYLLVSAEFPKTASLKIKRAQLAAALRAQDLKPQPLT